MKEKLNPWLVEVLSKTRDQITLNICNENTGEIRQIEFTVDDLNDLIEKREAE